VNDPRIALVTCAQLPTLDPDDRPLADALRAQGAAVEAPVWDDPSIAWERYDLVLVRSPWDYHRARDAFVAWAVATAEVATLLNPAEVIAWNTDKRYLRTLSALGVPTVPTAWVDGAADKHTDRARLAALVAERGWHERDVIVKPTIGLGSSGLLRVEASAIAGDAGQAHLEQLVASGDAMVQPFIDALEREGELSLVYFAGKLSHALRKRPAIGEFRVQPEFGAATIPEQPSDAQLDVAERALDAARQTLAREVVARRGAHDARNGITARAPSSASANIAAPELLYARVDLVAGDDGEPRLMELELVEPTLYFATAPGSVERFARLVLARAV
jgi:glutathione synthase/RimK-type ligase-like ATP-grasp enzyme